MKPFRNIPGDDVQDPSSIAAVEYNKYSGSQKVSEVGRRLKPISRRGRGSRSGFPPVGASARRP